MARRGTGPVVRDRRLFVSMRELLAAGGAVVLLAACAETKQAAHGVTAAYHSAVEAGEHVRLPSAGAVGLDQVNEATARRELDRITGLLPSGTDSKAALATACRAKQMYEDGTAATADQAAARALQGQGLHVSTHVISLVEQRLVRGAESNNPAVAAAAAFACKWAGS